VVDFTVFIAIGCATASSTPATVKGNSVTRCWGDFAWCFEVGNRSLRVPELHKPISSRSI
jgi:hypothetical protein